MGTSIGMGLRMSENSGFLRTCNQCNESIYLKQDSDGRWRPYQTWFNGTVQENQWVLHRCQGQVPGERRPVDAAGTGVTARDAQSPLDMQPLEERSQCSLDACCLRLVLGGCSVPVALDIISKAAALYEAMSAPIADPMEEIAAMVKCFDAIYRSKHVLEARMPPQENSDIPF